MKRIFTLLTGFSLCAAAMAQVPQLLKNINPTTVDVYSGSFPKKGIELNGTYYFPATDYNGNELWKTNGTAAGTSLIKDLASIFERQDANPHLFDTIGGNLYFFTGTGFQPWKYDPLTDKITAPIVGRSTGYSPTETAVIGNNIFFAGDWYFDKGIELIRYNVTSGSLFIYDINFGVGDSYPHGLTVKGDSLFFAANDGVNGNELWMYDALTNQFIMVKNINGTGSSNPSELVVYNGKLFFTAADGTNGNELWSSDGSETGTIMFADINTNNGSADSSNPGHKIVFNNKLYFSANNGNDGIELWVADDNTSSVSQLININPSGDSNPGNYGFKIVGSYLYFDAQDDFDNTELWKTNGVITELVKDINTSGSSNPMDMYRLGDTLIFTAWDGNTFQLWRSLGTAINTEVVQTIQLPGGDTIHISGIYNGLIYFGADNGVTGTELWKTDGKAANTTLVKDINLGSGVSSDPQWFEKNNSAMYFGARATSPYYFSLYKTDGTVGNATELKAGGGAANFSVSYEHGRKVGSSVYFSGYTSAEGNELWKTDGTAGGTVMVKDIRPGTDESSPGNMIEMGSLLVFVADDGINGRELWKSDGTAGGTVLVKDIKPGINSSDIREMRLVNGKVCFVANDGTTGEELWVTDGTATGTILLKDINGTAAGSDLSDMYSAGSKLYFSANDGPNGKEVWVSDGTTPGTVLLKDINPAGSSNPGWFAQLGGWVYFTAASANNTYSKIWRTDGTTVNTSQFYDIDFPFLLTNIGSKIAFIALPNGSTNGFHIWATDGTVAGTGEVEGFPGSEVGYFLLDEFPAYNGKWFLWIDNNVNGQELWQTDGTPAGTIMFDIAPGVHSSYPRSARGLNPLVFSANDGTITGREVWKLEVSPPLPITGLEFNVTKQTNKALLEWKTYSEINNKGFRVERSRNGIVFDSIAFVTARGTNGNGATYRINDENPFDGKNYYRLKQTDIDGRFTYSDTRWVDFSKEAYVKVFPNPTQDVLYINTGYTFRDATMSIRNMSGQLVKQIKVNGTGTITIPVKDLAAGVYSAEVVQPGQTVRLMFIKQ
jgi:ELWxxDGT repeat protein